MQVFRVQVLTNQQKDKVAISVADLRQIQTSVPGFCGFCLGVV